MSSHPNRTADIHFVGRLNPFRRHWEVKSSLTMNATDCERLWSSHAERLALFAASILSDVAAAEDAVQVVFTRLLSGKALPEMESEVAYLFRSVRNEAMDMLRSRYRADRAKEHLFTFHAVDPRQAADLEVLRRDVETSLFQLPQDQREAVVLKIWADLSFPEGAAVLSISEKAFEHRYYRGLCALEKILRSQE